jgi:hypothetical protein
VMGEGEAVGDLIAQRREAPMLFRWKTLRVNWRSEERRERPGAESVMTIREGRSRDERMESSDFVTDGAKVIGFI